MTAACQELQLYMDCREKLRAESLSTEDGAGNPLARIGAAALGNVLKILGKFGMTPADRRRAGGGIKTAEREEDDELTKWRRTHAGATAGQTWVP